jgi:hypothetical protein
MHHNSDLTSVASQTRIGILVGLEVLEQVVRPKFLFDTND